MTQYKKIVFTCCAVMFVISIAIALFYYAMMQKSEYDSEQNVRHWTNIQYGLWESDKTGDLAIRVDESDEGCYRDIHDYRFITHIRSQGGDNLKIKDVIDRESFRQTFDRLYQDKNHVYQHYSVPEGGFLVQTEIDTDTVEMIGSFYAQDKDDIYHIPCCSCR